jgi:hypothetical protein
MTDKTEKRGRGRPVGSTKAKKGALIWVQSDIVDSVQAFIDTLKAQQQKQAA